ncbi:hypothetical protein H0H87_002326 [Tephrocybe sp. NHM501043]|nr:hypothetical protein H0H87_002326 [Tephrocybe sp. NHM501043]
MLLGTELEELQHTFMEKEEEEDKIAEETSQVERLQKEDWHIQLLQEIMKLEDEGKDIAEEREDGDDTIAMRVQLRQ